MGKSKVILRTVLPLIPKILLHNNSTKAPLFCDNETWTINKRNVLEMRATYIRFLRPLMELQIPNRLRCSKEIKIITVEELKVHQNYLSGHLKRMDMN